MTICWMLLGVCAVMAVGEHVGGHLAWNRLDVIETIIDSPVLVVFVNSLKQI